MSSAVNVSLAVDGNRRSPRREDGAASVLARLRRALEQPARKLGDAGTAVGRGQKINIRV